MSLAFAASIDIDSLCLEAPCASGCPAVTQKTSSLPTCAHQARARPVNFAGLTTSEVLTWHEEDNATKWVGRQWPVQPHRGRIGQQTVEKIYQVISAALAEHFEDNLLALLVPVIYKYNISVCEDKRHRKFATTGHRFRPAKRMSTMIYSTRELLPCRRHAALLAHIVLAMAPCHGGLRVTRTHRMAQYLSYAATPPGVQRVM